ncbi:hypothetical protein LguiB_036343 [Lonicera macranthoides]
MDSPSFHEFKRQASFFFKDKIKTARLVLTDVTPAQLLTEEATDGDSWAPDTHALGLISHAAFEVDDYWRIVDILHKRLWKFDRKNWRGSYKALIVLENLLTHGPQRVAEEFQCDRDIIKEMANFHYVDDKGFNRGSSVRKRSERMLKLLEEEQRSFLKEERARARKITNGIKGFGSFYERSSGLDGNLKESTYVRCTSSHFTNHRNYEDEYLDSKKEMNANTNASSSIEDDYHPFCKEKHQITGVSLLSSM